MTDNEKTLPIATITKRYTCDGCKTYSNNVMAKINAHKRNCPALKGQMVKDHACPICGEKSDYMGLRLHLNQFIAKDGARIAKSMTTHSTKTLQDHKNIQKQLLEGYAEAKKSGVTYTPVLPAPSSSKN